MSGRTSLNTPAASAGAHAGRNGVAAAARTRVLGAHYPGHGAPPPPLAPSAEHRGTEMADRWPAQDFIELGPLPGAVPCARLHARLVLREWRHTALSESAELVLSELVTNAVAASSSLEHISPVRVWLLADPARVLIVVWDANPQPPVRIETGGDAEAGRGLLLVEAISSRWGTYPTGQTGGKAVWALIE